MGSERYKVKVTSYSAPGRWCDWEVLDTEETRLFDDNAQGIAPDESTARDCAELVAERLAGRDVRGELAALREALRRSRCVDDTDGDGNCGRRACPLCALLTPEAP